tara:strand:- start:253 stop:1128 length:876 start_codon:yes stop_codon:yes gene_type:complete
MIRGALWLSIGVVAFGCGLMVINLVGLAMSPRSPLLREYREPGWTRPLLAASEVFDQLSSLSPEQPDFIANVHAVFTYAIAHPVPESLRALRRDADKAKLNDSEKQAFGLTISPFDNWLLWLFDLVKEPGYYGHVFCDWRRAVHRGIGDCEQQSIAIVDFFAEHGLDTGFLMGWSHVAPMVKDRAGRWWLTDPDFGVLAQVSPDALLEEPARVQQVYRGVRNRGDGEPFGINPPNPPRFQTGSAASRYPMACPIEQLSYVLKWAIPLILIAFGAFILSCSRQPHRFREKNG